MISFVLRQLVPARSFLRKRPTGIWIKDCNVNCFTISFSSRRTTEKANISAESSRGVLCKWEDKSVKQLVLGLNQTISRSPHDHPCRKSFFFLLSSLPLLLLPPPPQPRNLLSQRWLVINAILGSGINFVTVAEFNWEVFGDSRWSLKLSEVKMSQTGNFMNKVSTPTQRSTMQGWKCPDQSVPDIRQSLSCRKVTERNCKFTRRGSSVRFS